MILRFSRDPDAVPAENETVIDASWTVQIPADASPVTGLMAELLVTFMERCMDTPLETTALSSAEADQKAAQAIILAETGGGDPDVPESFTIRVTSDRVQVMGRDPAGLRDGIVHLIDLMALRQAPYLQVGEQVYTPRVPVRLTWLPAPTEYCVLMGYNAITTWSGSLYAVSRSDAIPELTARRVDGQMEALVESVRQAKRYGLKAYVHLATMEKFPANDPVLAAHPELRGTVTWKEDGDYTICTEHPLVQQYLMESIEGIFEAVPELDGIIIIIGGEGFYHCFMRPYGVEKGHTNCPRCEALGPDVVVANLCNNLATAARKHNPQATVFAWPYSAAHVWSSDVPHSGFIRGLKPGTGVLTEMVKDEIIEKPWGVQKALWDYSIDMIGPGQRAQVPGPSLCREAGIPICVLSMAEGAFEASLLPGIPCMDRWMDRAEAFVDVGADVAYVWQIGPYHGTPSHGGL